MYKEFTTQNLHSIHKHLKKKFEEIEKEVGITFDIGSTKYNSNSMSIQIKGYINNDQVDGKKEEFIRLAPMFGLKPEHYNFKFKKDGIEFKIIQIDPKKRKYPVIAEGSNGKQYKLPLDVIPPLDEK